MAVFAIALSLASLAAAAGGDPGHALTNEDVVRMLSDRVPVAEIVKTIREARTTAFDLDPDIVIELRRAGVPDAVIDAMKDAQRETAPPPEKAPDMAGAIELHFERAPGASPQKNTAVTLAKDWNDRPVTLAFFAYCFDRFHVPDHWEAKTPLPASFPRHHMVWFHEGTLRLRDDRRGGLVYLDLPETAKVEASTGVHPMELGVVGRAGDLLWTKLTGTQTSVEVKAGAVTRVFVRIRTHRADRLNLVLGGTPWISCEVVRVEPPSAPGAAPDPNVAASP